MRAIPDKASGILSYFTRHRTAANLLLVLMLVAGIASFPQMRAQFFPDVISDEIDIQVSWDGAGAEDVDASIVAVLEPVLVAVPGVASTSATSREGRASIEIEFEPGWDMSRAADEVQIAIDSVTDLPEGADTPTVRRGAWWDRVTDVVITGPVAPDQLGRFADEFRRASLRCGRHAGHHPGRRGAADRGRGALRLADPPRHFHGRDRRRDFGGRRHLPRRPDRRGRRPRAHRGRHPQRRGDRGAHPQDE